MQKGDGCAMDTFISLLGVLAPSIASVVVVIITVRGERSKKLEEAEKKAAKLAQAEREKDIDQKLKDLSDKIDKIDGCVSGVETQVVALQKADEDTLADLRELTQHMRINGNYIHELSKIVTVLAEGMRDQHLDGNVTAAVTAFRTFERDTLSQLITNPTEN